MLRDPFTVACNLIERHTASDLPEAIAGPLLPALDAIAAVPPIATRQQIVASVARAGTMLGGGPKEVAALIDDLAGMQPAHREERQAVLTEAWDFLLADLHRTA